MGFTRFAPLKVGQAVRFSLFLWTLKSSLWGGFDFVTTVGVGSPSPSQSSTYPPQGSLLLLLSSSCCNNSHSCWDCFGPQSKSIWKKSIHAPCCWRTTITGRQKISSVSPLLPYDRDINPSSDIYFLSGKEAILFFLPASEQAERATVALKN